MIFTLYDRSSDVKLEILRKLNTHMQSVHYGTTKNSVGSIEENGEHEIEWFNNHAFLWVSGNSFFMVYHDEGIPCFLGLYYPGITGSTSTYDYTVDVSKATPEKAEVRKRIMDILEFFDDLIPEVMTQKRSHWDKNNIYNILGVGKKFPKTETQNHLNLFHLYLPSLGLTTIARNNRNNYITITANNKDVYSAYHKKLLGLYNTEYGKELIQQGFKLPLTIYEEMDEPDVNIGRVEILC